jgi:hypothetical protein
VGVPSWIVGKEADTADETDDSCGLLGKISSEGAGSADIGITASRGLKYDSRFKESRSDPVLKETVSTSRLVGVIGEVSADTAIRDAMVKGNVESAGEAVGSRVARQTGHWFRCVRQTAMQELWNAWSHARVEILPSAGPFNSSLQITQQTGSGAAHTRHGRRSGASSTWRTTVERCKRPHDLVLCHTIPSGMTNMTPDRADVEDDIVREDKPRSGPGPNECMGNIP